MRWLRGVGCLGLVAGLVSVASADPQRDTLLLGEVERSWSVYTPEAAGPWPAVIFLPGAAGGIGGAPPSLVAWAGEAGVLLIVPEVQRPGLGWTAHPEIFPPGEAPSDDLGFLLALREELPNRYAVDTRAVALVGQLSGGMMAWRMAAEAPEAFVAVAVVNGAAGVGVLATGKAGFIPWPASPVPLLVVHGMQNLRIPYFGGANPDGTRVYGPVPDAVGFWSDAVEADHVATLEGDGRIRVLYQGATLRAYVELIQFEELSDGWPSGTDVERFLRSWFDIVREE